MNSSNTSAEESTDGSWKPTAEPPVVGQEPTPSRVPASGWERRRLLVVHGSWVLLFFAAQPVPWIFALGVLVGALGQALRLWSAGILHKREVLATSGPYAHTRHPLYVGTGLQLLGCCALSGLWWSPLVTLPFFFICYVPTLRSEERFLHSRFGSEYQEYGRRVPRWGWRWRSAAITGPSHFSWHQARRNRELGAAFVSLTIIGLFALRFWW